MMTRTLGLEELEMVRRSSAGVLESAHQARIVANIRIVK